MKSLLRRHLYWRLRYLLGDLCRPLSWAAKSFIELITESAKMMAFLFLFVCILFTTYWSMLMAAHAYGVFAGAVVAVALASIGASLLRRAMYWF